MQIFIPQIQLLHIFAFKQVERTFEITYRTVPNQRKIKNQNTLWYICFQACKYTLHLKLWNIKTPAAKEPFSHLMYLILQQF